MAYSIHPSPKIWYFWSLLFFVLLAGGTFFGSSLLGLDLLGLALLLVLYVVLFAINCFLARFAVRIWAYELGDTSVVADEGVLNKKHTVLPFSNITDMYVKQDLLGQILGLADMLVDTAGGPRIELHAKHLEYQEAKAFVKILREEIEKAKAQRQTGEMGASETYRR